jgi:hypothetical protein
VVAQRARHPRHLVDHPAQRHAHHHADESGRSGGGGGGARAGLCCPTPCTLIQAGFPQRCTQASSKVGCRGQAEMQAQHSADRHAGRLALASRLLAAFPTPPHFTPPPT